MEADDEFELGALRSMYELEAALRRFHGLHIRCSEGPAADSESVSIDAESGLELPGLSANPLEPEDWWHRPVGDWLARQLHRCTGPRDRNPERYAWVLTGRIAGRGPDCEPLLANISPVARLAPELLIEAEERYTDRFGACGRAGADASLP